jgi:hypothetical protein
MASSSLSSGSSRIILDRWRDGHAPPLEVAQFDLQLLAENHNETTTLCGKNPVESKSFDHLPNGNLHGFTMVFYYDR